MDILLTFLREIFKILLLRKAPLPKEPPHWTIRLFCTWLGAIFTMGPALLRFPFQGKDLVDVYDEIIRTPAAIILPIVCSGILAGLLAASPWKLPPILLALLGFVTALFVVVVLNMLAILPIILKSYVG